MCLLFLLYLIIIIIFNLIFLLDPEAENLSKSLPAEIPNNISKFISTVKPIPAGQMKCNILKGILFKKILYLINNFFFLAKAEEEMARETPIGVATKLTNQMFVAAANSDETNLNSLNAATFVSVVSNIFIYFLKVLIYFTNIWKIYVCKPYCTFTIILRTFITFKFYLPLYR